MFDRMGEFNPMKALEPFENAKIEEDMKTRVNSLVVPIVSDGDLPSISGRIAEFKVSILGYQQE